VSAEEPSRVVRRPRYVPFLVTGFVLGLVATVVIVAFFGQQVDQPRRLTTYLGLLLGGLGTLAGGALAVWLERNH
jgi:H+/Cl- antiporter ClcA